MIWTWYTIDLPRLTRIPKKAKWSGALYIHYGADDPQLLCDVELKDHSDPKDTNKMTLQLLLGPMKSLNIAKLLHAPFLWSLYQASRRVQQYAKLVEADIKDRPKLQALCETMLTQNKVMSWNEFLRSFHWGKLSIVCICSTLSGWRGTWSVIGLPGEWTNGLRSSGARTAQSTWRFIGRLFAMGIDWLQGHSTRRTGRKQSQK